MFNFHAIKAITRETNIRSIIVQIQQRHFQLGQILSGNVLSVFAQTTGVLTLVQAL